MTTEIIPNKKLVKKITVLGIGNTLYSDEGLGVHIIPELERALCEFDNVEILEGATEGIRLLEPIEQCDLLIIIDAINAGKEPGTLIVLRDDEIPSYFGIKMSIHQLGFQEVLQAAKLLERMPEEMVMFGLQPHSLQFGIGLTEKIQDCIPTLIKEIKQQIHIWRELT
ncbi:HyaD/HybD family hydrogenase maturation endopeptidase [Bacillus solimangrovi]|uniref:Hydrogenase expression/formation protein n=1 Tax=Bacillus solimangrovi TaxID=1305675 RepID=A0A1E5LFG4_9BACI|nr:HyaD/HybD family hydrogenase maturation endopeptidase [Bacillus solimangrovi]OEH92814.1 hydrogenase expression/formation protein [Bacillus solimangrovi]